MEIWTFIPRLKIVIAGDLSFFATSTGRDGHSSCRCIYCDSSYTQWNDECSITPTIMTLPRIYQLADQHRSSTTKIDTKGVIMNPLFDMEPCYYIVPLLHLQIGIVNKLWSSLLHYLDEFVEQVSEIEAQINKINQIRTRKSSNSPSIQKRKVTKYHINGELKKIKREMVKQKPYFKEG